MLNDQELQKKMKLTITLILVAATAILGLILTKNKYGALNDFSTESVELEK
jgi:hypothetical protein